MERTYHNIVPAVVVDKTDSNKIDLKYFSNGKFNNHSKIQLWN